MDNQIGRYGRFCLEEPATYEINSLDMKVPWEYIYQNRDVLLRVDQFGPVSAQAYPPQDIMFFKRELNQRFSRWLVWTQCDQIHNGIPFSNFSRPVLTADPRETPDDFRIVFRPHEAVYSGTVDGLHVSTVLFVPNHGPRISMECTYENRTDRPLTLHLTPALMTYVNQAQLAPWDKPEWYLKTAAGMEEQAIFWSQLFSSASIKKDRRTAVLWTSKENLDSCEVSLEKFCGAGDFDHPQALFREHLRIGAGTLGDYGVYNDQNQLYGYPQVYASRYKVILHPGERKTIQQVLALAEPDGSGELPSLKTVENTLELFKPSILQQQKRERKRFFDELFAVRHVETADPFLNYYVNSWLPLQMYWVASLDRGWPTGMRGTRDCANDFMAEVYLDPRWAEEILNLVLECQKSNGWFPRQISSQGRKGNHDLRPYVDGGVFVLEFLHEYLCVTGDRDYLKRKIQWLDCDEESTVLEHAVRALQFYADPQNIGEHGLCKVRGGDWLDAVNRAGLEGQGETVMVTEQVIMAIEFVRQMAEYAEDTSFDTSFWRETQQKFYDALRRYALNGKGFFNGYFTDAGQWVFSDCDPDGQCRPYVCPNAYGIISGAAPSADSILAALETVKDETGYKLFSPAIGSKPIEKVGRSGSGDGPEGLFENGTPYNHGSHGFLGRALSVAGRKDELLDVFHYMLPFDMEKHPTDQALTPPYAVVNCWNKTPVFRNRGGMLFLTGTIAMSMRMVYNWILGIQPELNGLRIDPCCADRLGTVTADVSVRGKRVHLTLHPGGRELLCNGKVVTTQKHDPFTNKIYPFLPYDMLNQTVNDIQL